MVFRVHSKFAAENQMKTKNTNKEIRKSNRQRNKIIWKKQCLVKK